MTDSCPDSPKRNRRFPYCAEAARKLLCEAYGLKFGDKIPPADDLLAEARRLAALKWDEVDGDLSNNLKRWDSARAALAILDEIGGLFEPAADQGESLQEAS